MLALWWPFLVFRHYWFSKTLLSPIPHFPTNLASPARFQNLGNRVLTPTEGPRHAWHEPGSTSRLRIGGKAVPAARGCGFSLAYLRGLRSPFRLNSVEIGDRLHTAFFNCCCRTKCRGFLLNKVSVGNAGQSRRLCKGCSSCPETCLPSDATP